MSIDSRASRKLNLVVSKVRAKPHLMFPMVSIIILRVERLDSGGVVENRDEHKTTLEGLGMICQDSKTGVLSRDKK